MSNERCYHFYLNIDRDDLMRLYNGSARQIRARSMEGPVVEFDANHLRKFTTYSGINGRFRLVISAENRFLRLERI